MRQLLNTLYVTTERAYVHLDHDTLRVEADRQTLLQAPLLQLGAVVCFGDVLLSPALLHRCAEDGRAVVWLDRNGRFKARLEGPTSGNVLLRRAQHLALSDPERRRAIARTMIAGKLRNGRSVLLRAAREAGTLEDAGELGRAAAEIGRVLTRLPQRDDLDLLRGDEGEAARTYFGVFARMVRADRAAFDFQERTRRPPRDRLNALLSFLYTILRADCVAALEGVGLDPQVGYLHALRPGRPALALDLMEELRPAVADRLALTLVNRGQLTADDFEELPPELPEVSEPPELPDLPEEPALSELPEPSEAPAMADAEGATPPLVPADRAVYLTESGRKTVIVAYQKRKQEEVEHRLLRQKVPLGLIPHLQARLLARHLRDDLALYPPFLAR
jgi:CRISPR-associated protein Cas1